MNRDDIIRMAREAGAWDYYEINGDKYSDYSPLEKFAVLVAAAEREECAKIADNNLMDTTALTSLPEKSRAAWKIAAAIRARGET